MIVVGHQMLFILMILLLSMHHIHGFLVIPILFHLFSCYLGVSRGADFCRKLHING